MDQRVIQLLIDSFGQILLPGLTMTIPLTVISFSLAMVIAIITALVQFANIRVLKQIARFYIWVVRGTPLLLQLYFFYFMLPQFLPFLNLSEFGCVVIALVFNSIAYVAEIVRAGIDAVDRGQMEAARSLGLNGRQAMVRVILPQAVKNILPALCNEFVSVIKETSLASTFFIGDIMSQYKIINGFTFLIIEPLLIAGIIYFIITFVLSKGIAVLERRMKASD